MAHLLWPGGSYQETERILSNENSRARLLAFCLKESNPENVWFPLAVAQYRASPHWSEAHAIYRLFLERPATQNQGNWTDNTAGGAPFLVNVTEANFKEIEQKLGPNRPPLPSQDLFDNALTTILKLLQTDACRRFNKDNRVGMKGIEDTDILARTDANLERTVNAKFDVALQDRRLAKAARGGNPRAKMDQANRALIKSVLQAASFDLSVMGLT